MYSHAQKTVSSAKLDFISVSWYVRQHICERYFNTEWLINPPVSIVLECTSSSAWPNLLSINRAYKLFICSGHLSFECDSYNGTAQWLLSFLIYVQIEQHLTLRVAAPCLSHIFQDNNDLQIGYNN